jgi:hypothetical protein
MRLKIKWFLIGVLGALFILFVISLSNELGRGGDAQINSVLSTHSYEALIGMMMLIVYTAGLALIIPTIIIGITGFFIEKSITKRRLKENVLR